MKYFDTSYVGFYRNSTGKNNIGTKMVLAA